MIRKTSPFDIQPYLTDASNFPGGYADGVAFPENEKEIAEFMREAHGRNIPVTVAGNGTGLVGGRVPLGGWVLSLEKMKAVKAVEKDPAGKNSRAVAEAGIRLKDFQDEITAAGLMYPPDPTSRKTAFLGGTVATNASGPRTFKYGPTRDFIRRLRVVLAAGDVVEVKRGQMISSKEGFLEIPVLSSVLKIPVPTYLMPPVKNTAGYFARAMMDAVDLFIGSEGTLGVVTEIEAACLPLPRRVTSMVAFFKREEDSWKFTAEARNLSRQHQAMRNDAAIQTRALEYLDGPSLDLVRAKFSEIPPEARAAIFLEQECQNETEEMLLEEWYKVLERHHAIMESLWVADDMQVEERQREFRHQVPVEIREFLKQSGQSKVGTDMAVPHEHFEELMLYQRKRLEELKLPNVTFGHIGDSHVHLNILPKTPDEHAKGLKLHEELIQKTLDWGGTVAAEHGIGKIKRPYLVKMFGEEGVREMLAVKRALDPKLLLGRGNLWDYPT